MKILETQSAVLTNYEVLKHVNDVSLRYVDQQQEQRRRRQQQQQQQQGGQQQQQQQQQSVKQDPFAGKPHNLKAVMKELHRYLTLPNTPLSQIPELEPLTSPSQSQSQPQPQPQSQDHQSEPAPTFTLIGGGGGGSRYLNDSTFRTLITTLGGPPFHLTKAELLMILNLRPENQEFLEPVVEEIEARFGEEDSSGGGGGGGGGAGTGADDDGSKDERRRAEGGAGGAGIDGILEVVRECMGGDYASPGDKDKSGDGNGDRDGESMQGVET